MRRTKPQKRLVSKGQFVRLLGAKVGLYSLGSVVNGCGLILALIAVIFLLDGLILNVMSSQGQGSEAGLNSFEAFITGLISGLISAGSFYFGRRLLKAAKTFEAVSPITSQNSHLLPLQETLVRGSSLPPSEQQAELLRAAQLGYETPKEELLRATQRK